ncbi:hypothetical protein EVAR_100376_1 [Eumeta japonica]|uniref:Uncharacterized protein n=1 Tax=Eumeta variegata TaxID=151549 RepID=A0A4C1ZV14_EUMVA|nr:hypothetical protein EVAR_100376_1 [Eumeta japonica]
MQPRIPSEDQLEKIVRTRPKRVILNEDMKALRPLNAKRELEINGLAALGVWKERAMQFLLILSILPLTTSLTLADCTIFPKNIGWGTVPAKGKDSIL